MKRNTEPECVARLRGVLERCGMRLSLTPSPKRVDLKVRNHEPVPVFELLYAPGASVAVLDARPAERLLLLELEELPGHKSRLLLGMDESQLFALRLREPETCASVQEALEFITPRAVFAARERGIKVLRQGDIWFVPIYSVGGAAIDHTRHEAEHVSPLDSGLVTGWIHHPEHAPLHLKGWHMALRNRLGD